MAIFAPVPQAWQSYTPTITGASVNPNLGSTGTITGKYVQIGKTVHFEVQITTGGTGISAGTGIYSVSLPITADVSFQAANTSGGKFLGLFNLFLGSGATFPGGIYLSTSTTISSLLWWVNNNTANTLQSNAPWSSTLGGLTASGSVASFQGIYEAA